MLLGEEHARVQITAGRCPVGGRATSGIERAHRPRSGINAPRSPVDLAGEPLEQIPLPSPRAPVNDAVAVVRHGAYVCPVLHQPFGRRRMATRSATLPRAILT